MYQNAQFLSYLVLCHTLLHISQCTCTYKPMIRTWIRKVDFCKHIRPSTIHITNTFVVDVATNHDREYHPDGPWLLVVMVNFSGENGGPQTPSLSCQPSFSIYVFFLLLCFPFVVVSCTPTLVRGFWWSSWFVVRRMYCGWPWLNKEIL